MKPNSTKRDMHPVEKRRQSLPKAAPNVSKNLSNGNGNGAIAAAVSMGEASLVLGMDPRAIRRLCATGRLESFSTPGGHVRVLRASIESFLNGDSRRGNAEPKAAQSTSSPLTQNRKQATEELKSLIEQKKAALALQEIEDAERQRAEQREAARRAEEDATRRAERDRHADQVRRDREREEREEQREEQARRQIWQEEMLEHALGWAPPELAARFADEIQEAVEQELEALDPASPQSLVDRRLSGAVNRALEPHMRAQQRRQNIERAAVEASRPFSLPELTGETQVYAQEQALRALLELPEDVTSYDQLFAVARAAVQRVCREEREREQERREQEQVWQEQARLARAQQDQERAQRLIEQVEELARQKRERDVEYFLTSYLMPALKQIEQAGEIEFERGEIDEIAPKIRAAIKPELVKDSSTSWHNARQRVGEFVQHWIDDYVEEPA